MIDWESRCKRYLETLERGRQETTLRSIRNRLYMLTRYIGGKELTIQRYEDWLTWAKENYSYMSVNRAHKEIRRFAKFLRLPILDDLELMRVPEKLPPIKTLDSEQLSKVIDWSIAQTGVNWRRRCGIYLLILATSGMRAGEAIRLKWEHWDKSTHTFHLEYTKTGHTRIAAYSPDLTPLLEKWRNDYQNKHGETPWVIPSLVMRKHHAQYTAIQIKIKERLNPIFGFHFSSKVFRSTMVQRIIDSGGRYEEAAAVVGHRDIGVTQRHYSRIKMTDRAMDARTRAMNGLWNKHQDKSR